jgi:predicted metal-dependent phosphoesterase TrpH
MSQKIVADLHNHSTASDGELSPSEVIKQAAEKGLEAVALTDHDTITGLDEALQAGSELDIKVIPGVELTLRFRRPSFVGSLHLLLYFQPKQLKNREYLQAIQTLFTAGRGTALVRDRVESINQFFGPDSPSSLLKRPLTVAEIEACGDNITRRHFAKVLGENHHLKRHQVDDIVANRSPAYLPSGIDPSQVLPLRKNFSLLAFLAHPAAGSFPPPSHYREVLPPWPIVAELLPEFMALTPIAIDGLEIEYPGHREKEKKILRELATSHKLLVSGGSDGHDLKERPYGVAGINREDFSRFMVGYDSLE